MARVEGPGISKKGNSGWCPGNPCNKSFIAPASIPGSLPIRPDSPLQKCNSKSTLFRIRVPSRRSGMLKVRNSPFVSPTDLEGICRGFDPLAAFDQCRYSPDRCRSETAVNRRQQFWGYGRKCAPANSPRLVPRKSRRSTNCTGPIFPGVQSNARRAAKPMEGAVRRLKRSRFPALPDFRRLCRPAA